MLLVCLLSCLLLLVEGQQSLGQSNAGYYHASKRSNLAVGQLPMYEAILLTPPSIAFTPGNSVGWAQSTWQSNTFGVTGNFEPEADKVSISLSGLASEVSYQAPSVANWGPYNRYFPVVVQDVWMPLGNAANLQGLAPVTVTSSPPCNFVAAVNSKGDTLTLWVVSCARRSVITVPGGVPTSWEMMTIFVPAPFLAANPSYPQWVVQTQAVFSFWNAGANAFVALPSVAVVVPWVTSAPELALSHLQFKQFYPGNPSGNIPINTIGGTDLQAITVRLQPGVQLQGGNQIGFAVSVGPVNLRSDVNADAPPQLVPTNSLSLIWAAPGTVTTLTTIPLGPGGSRAAGSVNCCSQSTAQVLQSAVSLFTYPGWWNVLVITLSPAGCVLPADKEFTFVIPKAYLGVLPSQSVLAPVNNGIPGFLGIDVRVFHSSEPHWQPLQRYSENDPVCFANGFDGVGTNGVTLTWPDAAIPLQAANRMTPRMCVLAMGPSAFVVGASTLAALKVTIDTTVATLQPQSMTISVTLQTGLSPRQDATTNPITDLTQRTTDYYLVVTATQGVFRANVASVASPTPLAGSLPGDCASSLSAFTTAHGTLFVRIGSNACLAVLQTNAVLTFNLQSQSLWLLPNPTAGTTVFFDARILPSLWSVANTNPPFAGAVTGAFGLGDTAALMQVFGYTTTAECRVMNYAPGGVSDIVGLSQAARCQLVSSIAQISPVSGGFLQCNPGATVSNAQNLINYVKFPEGPFNGGYWPGTNVGAPASTWPQNIALSGTPPIYVLNWGVMFSTPMFAVAVSYPPSPQNLQALGAAPSIPSTWLLAFLLKVDRMTVACSVPNEPNPFSFCVTTAANVQAVYLFPSNPTVSGGVSLDQQNGGRWTRNAASVCVTTVADGAIAGWYVVGVSPTTDDSDGAWYAFFAFFALPLLLLCCCLLWALWFFKKRSTRRNCCPAAVPEYPVQEMYWVNAQPAAPVYMMEPAVNVLPMTAPNNSPVYFVG